MKRRTGSLAFGEPDGLALHGFQALAMKGVKEREQGHSMALVLRESAG